MKDFRFLGRSMAFRYLAVYSPNNHRLDLKTRVVGPVVGAGVENGSQESADKQGQCQDITLPFLSRSSAVQVSDQLPATHTQRYFLTQI